MSLCARSVHLRHQHVHAWNARSKQRHVPDPKQVLLWKEWVLKQKLNDVQSRVGATATRAHVEPALRTELFVDSCSVTHQGNCCTSTRETPATWISIRAQATKRCSCDKTAALTRHKNTWISLRAQRDVFRRKDSCVLTPRARCDFAPCANRHVPAKRPLHSHAVSTLGSLSVRKKTCFGEQLLGSHAANTVGSLSVRKETCSIEKAAAFHVASTLGYRSVRKQKVLFMRQHGCVRTPQAHLDLTPCANRHVPAKRLLRSQAARSLGSRSVRSDLALPPKMDDFYLRTPDPVSTVKRAHVPYAIGNP